MNSSAMPRRKPVLNATHRKTVALIVVVAVHSDIIVVQVAVPSVSSIILCRGPKVRVRAAIVERTVGVAVASK